MEEWERDDYLIPNAPESVLRNRLNTTDKDEISRYERTMSGLRQARLERSPVPQTFDRAHLSAIHERLFGDVYEWAGRMRDETFTLSDGTEISPKYSLEKGLSGFSPSAEIDERFRDIANQIKATNSYQGSRQADFTRDAARIYHEINVTHAFREGNGRTQRVFISDLGRAAGHEVDWSVIDDKRNLRASIAAHEGGDLTPMREMLRDVIQPDRAAMLTEARAHIDNTPELAWLSAKDDEDRSILETRTLLPFSEVEGIYIAHTGNAALLTTDQNELIIARANDVPANVEQYAQVTVRGSFEPSDYGYHPKEARSVALDQTSKRVAEMPEGAARDVAEAKLEALQASPLKRARDADEDYQV